MEKHFQTYFTLLIFGMALALHQWPWCEELAGAYFLDHPSDPGNVQEGKFTLMEKDNLATSKMLDEFLWPDEFYSFLNISPKINVLMTVDESSYVGGKIHNLDGTLLGMFNATAKRVPKPKN